VNVLNVLANRAIAIAGLVVIVQLLVRAPLAMAISYSAEPLEGIVLEDETKQPMAGVIVLADWSLRTYFFEYKRAGELVILETLTDEHGHYAFRGWGPIEVYRPNTYLYTADPIVFFLKSRYRDVGRSNTRDTSPDRAYEPIRRASWNDKPVLMHQLKADDKEAAVR
jgi:hypothetical protein